MGIARSPLGPGYPPQLSQTYAMYGTYQQFPSMPSMHMPATHQNYASSQPRPVSYPQVSPTPYGMIDPSLYATQSYAKGNVGYATNRSIPASAVSYPRGPPRKPKQSGHALWVGNLPPGTTVTDLKDHFSREATKEIESLFLISKSNCAFVNYKTEVACTAAMKRFHDSRFNGVRLVCRPRRESAPSAAATATASPRPSDSNRADNDSKTIVATATKSDISGETPGSRGSGVVIASGSSSTPLNPDSRVAAGNASAPGHNHVEGKYFIVKSLTLQDLEASVRNGVWATQAHNEAALNEAFQSADNVYLIFSANRSGEYFGYARMTSRIADENDPIDEVEQQRQRQSTDSHMEGMTGAMTSGHDDGAPKSIPTPATEWAPRGRIVDDSARGTIFWEAQESPEEEEGAGEADETTEAEGGDHTNPSDAADTTNQEDGINTPALSTTTSTRSQVQQRYQRDDQGRGRPFEIQWLSTDRLPFYRTRGLRNPWNANREVKIARDGTELEPGIGKRLIQMFHQQHGGNNGRTSVPRDYAQQRQQQQSHYQQHQALLPMGSAAPVGEFYAVAGDAAYALPVLMNDLRF
ncbi:hypothetical protein AAFC00_003588 [Neodothiora populina]